MITMSVLWMGLTAVANAETPAPKPAEEHVPALLAVGVHLGPSFPLQDLGVSLLPRLEVGVLPTSLNESLMIFVTGAWTAPGASGQATDPRVAGGVYDWDLVVQQIQLGAGLTIRLSQEPATIDPEVSLGPQLVLLQTLANGSAGSTTGGGGPNPFGTTKETWATWGLLAAVGLGVDAGPGRALLRFEFTTSPLEGTITGSSTTSAFAPTLGYRFMF